MFSSKTDDWETPQKTFDELDREFHFTTDVAASSTNFKVKHFYDKQTDGLKQGWTGTCWMNPPYGRAIGDWVKKAYEHAGWQERRRPSASCHPAQIRSGGMTTA